MPSLLDVLHTIKDFSTHYANAVSAIAALGALIIASATALFLCREYRNKYRPYVVPDVSAEPFLDGTAFEVRISTRNVGPHPCEFRLSQIHLHIGDETYQTPDFKELVLISPNIMQVQVSAWHVNEAGIQNIRAVRYRTNRIEVNFSLATRSADKRYVSKKSFAYQIWVHGESPVIHFRPERQASS